MFKLDIRLGALQHTTANAYSFPPRRFSKLVADPELRKTFVESVVKFLRQHQFDGLDLDWEYPATR